MKAVLDLLLASMFQLIGYGQTKVHTLKLTKHCTYCMEMFVSGSSMIDLSITGTCLSTVLYDACMFMCSRNVSTYLETRLTYSRINIHKVIGRIDGFFSIRPYQGPDLQNILR